MTKTMTEQEIEEARKLVADDDPDTGSLALTLSDFIAEVDRLRAELGHVESAEEPDARMTCTDYDSMCECCGKIIATGSEVAMWFEEQRTVIAHWGSCPEAHRG